MDRAWGHVGRASSLPHLRLILPPPPPPLVPGPCQLLRWSNLDVVDGPLDMYAKVLLEISKTGGLVKSSLSLAEDRVLSIGLSLRCQGQRTRWVPPCLALPRHCLRGVEWRFPCHPTPLNAAQLRKVATPFMVPHRGRTGRRYIAEAEFMFEAEVTWMQLLSQRRR